MDAEPTASAGGGAAIFEGVLPLMVRCFRFMVKDQDLDKELIKNKCC